MVRIPRLHNLSVSSTNKANLGLRFQVCGVNSPSSIFGNEKWFDAIFGSFSLCKLLKPLDALKDVTTYSNNRVGKLCC